MLRQFCKNGHPGGKLTWINLQRMAQLVWYFWCKGGKEDQPACPKNKLVNSRGRCRKRGGAKKKKIQHHDSTELLFCCREVSSARRGTRSMMGVVIGMFISRVWDWSRLIYRGGVLKIMLLLPKIKSKEKTFPSLNQTGESCSLDLNLASSLACVCLPPPPKHQLGMKGCLQHVSQIFFNHPWVKLCWYVTLHCFEALGILTYEAFGWEGCLYAQDQI